MGIPIVSELRGPIDNLKLKIISVDEFTDEEVKKDFLEHDVQTELEIDELVGCLEKHRPGLYKELQPRGIRYFR